MKKNYWPIGIVGIIVFGMVIISVGVGIAVKNPVVDEQMFGAQKRVIDEQINDVLREQRFFENLASVQFSVNGRTIMLQNPYDKVLSTPNISKFTPDFFRIHATSECVLEILPKNTEFNDFIFSSMTIAFSSLSSDFGDIAEIIFDDKNIGGVKPLVHKFSINDMFVLKNGVYKMEVGIKLTKKSLQDTSHSDALNAFFETRVEVVND